SYLTIELRGPIPEEFHEGIGQNVFGCDICQDVCPWNSRAPVTGDPAFSPSVAPVEELAALSEGDFRSRFSASPIVRAKYAGVQRNVAIVMRNSVRRELDAHEP